MKPFSENFMDIEWNIFATRSLKNIEIYYW